MAVADHEEVLSLLDDEYARAILVETSREALSAEVLSRRCDASEPTIYRRIDRLRDHGLVEERQPLDPDGHHYKTYAASLERITVELEDGDLTVEVETAEDAADRFTRLYEEFR